VRLQLVGGPYDGIEFEHPVPLPPHLALVVMESEDDMAFVETVLASTGEMPSDDIAPTYEKCEYLLVLRRGSEPIYLYRGESHHDEATG
jgi:hypothetical protein